MPEDTASHLSHPNHSSAAGVREEPPGLCPWEHSPLGGLNQAGSPIFSDASDPHHCSVYLLGSIEPPVGGGRLWTVSSASGYRRWGALGGWEHWE